MFAQNGVCRVKERVEGVMGRLLKNPHLRLTQERLISAYVQDQTLLWAFFQGLDHEFSLTLGGLRDQGLTIGELVRDIEGRLMGEIPDLLRKVGKFKDKDSEIITPRTILVGCMNCDEKFPLDRIIGAINRHLGSTLTRTEFDQAFVVAPDKAVLITVGDLVDFINERVLKKELVTTATSATASATA